MTLTEFFELVTEGVFLLLAILTFIDWLRWRDRPRLDIALVFTSFAAVFLFQNLADVTGSQPRWQSVVGGVTLLAHPYLLLRVAGHFRPPSRWAHRLALAGLLLSVVSLLLFPENLPPPAVAVIAVYFVGVEAYAAVEFVSGAARAAGVPRRRLTLAALGSGFLAGLILLAVIASYVPGLEGRTGVLFQGIAIVSGLCYFLGFAPPRALRRAWQFPEVFRLLQRSSRVSASENVSVVLDNLCRAAAGATGSLDAVVVEWDETRQQLQARDPAWAGLLAEIGDDLQRAWREGRPAFALPVRDLGPAAPRPEAAGPGVVYVAPIGVAGRPSRGLLLAFRSVRSPFAADDIQLLALLAERSAATLEYVTLIAEQQRLIVQLERQTAQLEAANKELEAFSYSVSHDLRAPLRSLAGFSQALLEDYGERLDEQGQDYLRRVRAAAARMGDLIDDLLSISRVSRAEMRRSQVNLSELARSVAEELQKSQPDRRVEFAIAEGLVAEGDARLLRVALDNLLGNAWKFTRHQAAPRVEFGVAHLSGRPVYFVRDNGAGFDMAYANKLFGAFQRLHRPEEFPGTGIGLATVQRIIRRHGGHVCAEGRVGQGAIFHFTLP